MKYFLSRWSPLPCLRPEDRSQSTRDDDKPPSAFLPGCPVAVSHCCSLEPSQRQPQHPTPMPYPRPVSPITFETCAPPASDIGPEDLLGSDDELDDTARAAKRRKIEKIAESYLQGNPLFILSASLRGPFDKDWTNPWKKERRSSANDESAKVARNGSTGGVERVVQETDLRLPRYREDLSVASQHPEQTVTFDETSATVSNHDTASSFVPRSGQKRSLHEAARDEKNRDPPSSAKKSRDSSSWTADEPIFVGREKVKWLKKDGKRLDFGKFEPPSSPTPKIVSRQLEDRSRRSATCVVGGPTSNASSRAGSPRKSRKSTAPEKSRVGSAVLASPQYTRTADSVAQEAPTVVKPSPRRHQMSPTESGHAASSFRVINSSSQLPQFEYRRWHRQGSSPRAQLKSPAKDAVAAPPACIPSDQDARLPVPDVPEECNEASAEDSPKKADHPSHPSKDLRFADDAGGSNSRSPDPSGLTEQSTYENLPSAQQVAVPPGVSDRMPSLQSTAMLKADSELNWETNLDTQLSTQAALLHAQKSFQDDLESPEQGLGITPGRKRPASPSADDSVLLANETPFFRPNTSDQNLLRSSRQFVKHRMQTMSTQCMIDAATPYTFSTEKKLTAYRPTSPYDTSIEKSKAAHASRGLADSPNMSSSCPENEYQTAQSSAGNSVPRELDQQLEQAPIHRSTTQGTTLPFTLSGSIPTMAQDGQGGLQGADSFNLSQAIADAGSWLQQSFEFWKEIRHPSLSARAGSSQDAPPSALNLDISR